LLHNIRTVTGARVVTLNHPRDVHQNFTPFGPDNFDASTGEFKAKPKFDCDAIEVVTSAAMQSDIMLLYRDWFALLNHGHRMAAVGSSDSHHLRTSPVGYPRTCLWFGHDDPKQLTANAVRDAVAAGSATVSGGLFMAVEGPGGERPGESVAMASGTALFRVTVQAPSWIDATELEVIVGGETTHVEPLMPLGPGPAKRFVNELMVSMPPNAANSWVVFHAKGETDLSPLHPGRRPFAASNPIFLAR